MRISDWSSDVCSSDLFRSTDLTEEDMNGRCDIQVKGLHVSKGETVLPWNKSSLWKAPANVTQDCRNFCNHPMIGQQCGDASFGIDAQIFGRQLIALGKVHRYAFEIRPRLLKRDMGHHRTCARRIKKFQGHVPGSSLRRTRLWGPPLSFGSRLPDLSRA